MIELINTPGFWAAVLQIIAIDILLSGDNAIVIALACRSLPPKQRRLGIFWGVVGAISLRVVLTFFAVGLLSLPWLKLIGGALLLWIGIQLLIPEASDEPNIKPADHLWGAIRTIIIADFVMSLDNVIGVAAAAKDNVYLLAFGLLLSVPLIAWSSQLVLKVMERFPVVIVLGAGLLGWVAGGMMLGDVAISAWVKLQLVAWPQVHYLVPALCTVLVVVAGKALERRMLRRRR
ncbi:MAG: TerC family protein [Pseudomonadota bacterium]